MMWFRFAGPATQKIIIGVAASVVLSSAVARADLLYSSGPILGTTPLEQVSQQYAVTQSFTVAESSTLASATLGLWTGPTFTPLTIDWSIGTATFGSDISSGTAAPLTNVFIHVAPGYGYSVYASSFNLSGSLTPGTYYLTLTEGNYGGVGPGMFWDANSGTSSGYYSEYGIFLGHVGSAAFSLFGTPAASPVPEPSTFAFMASGLCLLLGFVASGGRKAKRSTVAA
jgi:hypothetical protein